MTLDERCQPIELILSDVDGVLTDGSIVLDNQGIETKRFSTRDGLGVRLWQKAGYRFGLISLRSSQIVKMRAEELGIEIVRQASGDKSAAMRQVLDELRLSPEQTCFLGDDLPDLAAVRAAGLGVAVGASLGAIVGSGVLAHAAAAAPAVANAEMRKNSRRVILIISSS